MNGVMNPPRWDLLELVRLFTLFIVYYALGIAVQNEKIKVNYSRKIVHFTHILSPLLVNKAFYDYSMDYFIKSGLITLFFPLLFIDSIRRRLPILQTLFHAFDRPEDRPYTVKLAFTQQAAMYLVLIGMAYLYQFSGINLDLLAVPLMITAFGDGLAEPVGVRFGDKQYQVTGLFTDRTYTRSIEGSSMVLLATLLTLVAYRDYFNINQIIVLSLYMPFKMTVIEAYSPHTWDNPFLYLAGGLIVYLAKILI